MRFVAGRDAVTERLQRGSAAADSIGHHGRDIDGRATVAKMLAEPMRTGGAAAAEHLQRGSAVAKCHQEDAACWGAVPRGRIADAAGGKERKRITAYRCE